MHFLEWSMISISACDRYPVRMLLSCLPEFREGRGAATHVSNYQLLRSAISAYYRRTRRNLEAACHVSPDIDINVLAPMQRRKLIHDTVSAARTLRRLKPDLLVTYNWGSIEWAIANRLLSIAPQLHFEDGFGRDEADRQFRRRVLCRHWALARCKSVVVPSRRLECIGAACLAAST